MEYNAVYGHGVTISIQRFPDRKSEYICIEQDGENGIYAIAPIRVDGNAEAFITGLAKLCGAKVVNK